MLIDKPEWVSHGASPIFSLDVDATGQRLATAGADNRVRIWATGPILSETLETDGKTPKLLATLSEHCGAVNVARFSKTGKMIASGSDDKHVVVYQRQPGPGRSVFGSKEPPSVENWRPMHSMHAHSSNVTDLAWAPDESMLASASLDNMVIVWDVASGHVAHKLSGHYGCVKGVAWDPFNAYLASQGEDGIFIWRTDNWTLLTKIRDPLGDQITTAAFHMHLNWSPDGQLLAGVCGFDKPMHQAICINRNTWDAPYNFCGHKGIIQVAKYNPCMFYLKGGNSDEVQCYCALGSGDKSFSVWSLSDEQPAMVGQRFFNGGVMDVAWSPDGYTLFAASYDGTVAVCRLDETELGKRVPEEEVQKLIAQLYGDTRTRGRTLIAGADLLALEAGGNPSMGLEPEPSLAAGLGPGPSSANGGGSAAVAAGGAGAGTEAGAPPQLPPPKPTAALPPGVAAGSKVASQMDKLSSRLGGPGGSTGGFGAPAAAAPAAGTKRMAPTLVGALPAGAAARVLSPQKARAGGDGPAAKRQAVAPVVAAPAAVAAQVPAAGTASSGAQLVLDAAPRALLPAPAQQNLLSVVLGTRPRESGNVAEQQGGEETVTLEALNTLRDYRGQPLGRLVCAASGRHLWFDSVQGAVLGLAGSLHFSAAATSHGDLLVFSAAGRRLLPPIALGGPPAYMADDGEWRLMVVGCDLRVRVWDVRQQVCVLDTSAAALLATPGAAVGAVRLSPTGAPVIVMKSYHAYTYHTGMAVWVRVADDAFPASQFHSQFGGARGELGKLQAEVAATRRPADVIAASQAPADWLKRASRAHLESAVASALAMRSSVEWKRWLLTYVKQLAADEDEGRLREIVSELRGPVRWTPSSHGQGPVGAGPGGAPYGAQLAPLFGGAGAGGYAAWGWQPEVLGLDKRKLLQEVLRELARVRTPVNQKLAQEALETLREAQQHLAQHVAGQQQSQQGGGGGGGGGAAPAMQAGGWVDRPGPRVPQPTSTFTGFG